MALFAKQNIHHHGQNCLLQVVEFILANVTSCPWSREDHGRQGVPIAMAWLLFHFVNINTDTIAKIVIVQNAAIFSRKEIRKRKENLVVMQNKHSQLVVT